MASRECSSKGPSKGPLIRVLLLALLLAVPICYPLIYWAWQGSMWLSLLLLIILAVIYVIDIAGELDVSVQNAWYGERGLWKHCLIFVLVTSVPIGLDARFVVKNHMARPAREAAVLHAKQAFQEASQKGEELLSREDFLGALEQFDKALEINEKDKTCLLYRAGCLLAVGKRSSSEGDEAWEAYKRTAIAWGVFADLRSYSIPLSTRGDTPTIVRTWWKRDIIICDAVLAERKDLDWFSEKREEAQSRLIK